MKNLQTISDIFVQGLYALRQFFVFVVNNIIQILHTIHIILFIFSAFFLTLIIYVIIRMYEIRKKEHAFLHHEIAEYAHKHSQDGQSLHEEISHPN